MRVTAQRDPGSGIGATSRAQVSLVLGAGGARGYAHIGAIEELLAQGFEIRAIAGSSMGAVIGGVYAAGKLDAYRDWVCTLQRFDVLRLLDWTLSGGGFIKGDRIIDALKDLIGETDIDDLPIAYTAVAVDLDAQREVWFSNGPLFDAIRASIAIPTVFRPHRYLGRTFIDGGLLNPLPVSATLRDLTDCTIAVDVNAPAERLGDTTDDDRGIAGQGSPELAGTGEDKVPRQSGHWRRIAGFVESFRGERDNAPAVREARLFDLLERSLDIVQETITRLKLAAQPPDLLITVPRNVCAIYDFHRAEEVIEIGRRRTREALERWRASPSPQPQPHVAD
ncbi:MAG: patatin-like phospholipase family protein [Rhodanobacteraceae bacterium]